MTTAGEVRTLRPEAAGRQLVVSFSGLDGAGKTRQIRALQEHLAAGGHSFEVIWVPFKIWPEQLINRLPADLRARLGPQRRAATPTSGAVAPLAAGPGRAAHRRLGGAARRVAWTGISLVASVSAGMSLRRRVARTSASVVILDRYRLDSIVKLQLWYGDVGRAPLARLVRRLAPAPDVELLLRVGPDVAYGRKQEQWSLDQLARQAGLYDTLAASDPGVVVLDGSRHPDLVAADIRRAVSGVPHAV